MIVLCDGNNSKLLVYYENNQYQDQIKTTYKPHGFTTITAGADSGGEGAPSAPLKLERKMIFLRKIVIFSHEIPPKFSRLPPLGAIFFQVRPPQLEILDPPLNWY